MAIRSRGRAARLLESALLSEGWQEGRFFLAELREFGKRERALPALAQILPRDRKRGARDKVREAIVAAWMVGARIRARSALKTLDAKLTEVNRIISRPRRKEHRDANETALEWFVHNFSWADYPQEKKAWDSAVERGDGAQLWVLAAVLTREVPSATPPALLANHPEYRGALEALLDTTWNLVREAPARRAGKRRNPRTIASALAPAVESEYRHLDPSKRTEIAVKLIQKYFPDEIPGIRVSAAMRNYRTRAARR